MRKIVSVTMGLLFVALSLCGFLQDHPADLVVHEWGTFTTVNGSDGVSLEWRSLVDSDLPRFVYSAVDTDYRRQTRDSAYQKAIESKKEIASYQRMETPVTYFYTDREMDVDVEVRFPDGILTEWYPHVRSYYPVGNEDMKNGWLRWGKIHLIPDGASGISLEAEEKNHYSFARETDSAYVRVCNTGELGNDRKTEYEKFLFYRGVANFTQPLSVVCGEKCSYEIRNNSAADVSHVFLVSIKQGGKGKYAFLQKLEAGKSKSTTLELNENCLTPEMLVRRISEELQVCLEMEGLYKKEAAAMIKTWKSSWFTEVGTRVFYIVPQKTTDAFLPISISPKPKELVRVMVGRIECITAEQERKIEAQIAGLADEDPAAREFVQKQLERLGRFAEPTIKRVLKTATNPEIKRRCEHILDLLLAKK